MLSPGGTGGSFAIVVTAANDTLAPIRDPMPVILKPTDRPAWFGGGEGDPAALLRPAAEGVQCVWPAGRAANLRRNTMGRSYLIPLTRTGRREGARLTLDRPLSAPRASAGTPRLSPLRRLPRLRPARRWRPAGGSGGNVTAPAHRPGCDRPCRGSLP